ncbi:hypothetical protein ABE354_24085 [Brevibacillus laterosporus]|uniref:hypothetical protein n=1 Tax=Brevibacillus laterosporus TaxID=1465 RepID=UPI003D2628A4
MANVYIREGTLRSGFSLVYHDIWDIYHPYIGDKATLYYLFLLRFRNNDESSFNHGKSWRGRKGIVEKFQLSYSTLPLLDGILSAIGLVDIETRPSPNGADKIYYTVHDPLTEAEFAGRLPGFIERLREMAAAKPEVRKLLGKEKGREVSTHQ